MKHLKIRQSKIFIGSFKEPSILNAYFFMKFIKLTLIKSQQVMQTLGKFHLLPFNHIIYCFLVVIVKRLNVEVKNICNFRIFLEDSFLLILFDQTFYSFLHQLIFQSCWIFILIIYIRITEFSGIRSGNQIRSNFIELVHSVIQILFLFKLL